MEPASFGVKNWLMLVKAWAQTLNAPWIASGVTPPAGAGDGGACDVFAAWIEVELRIGGVLNEVGVEADPVVIERGCGRSRR